MKTTWLAVSLALVASSAQAHNMQHTHPMHHTAAAQPQAVPNHGKGFFVDNAWARPTIAGAPTGAAYLVLTNHTDKEVVLKEAAAPVAASTMIHENIMENGVMKMRMAEGGLKIPAGKSVAMQPGGYHIMFMGMKQVLKKGQRFPLTLKFDGAPEKTINVLVK